MGGCGDLLGFEMNCWVFSFVFGLCEPKLFAFSKNEGMYIYLISWHYNSCDINMFNLVLGAQSCLDCAEAFLPKSQSPVR